MISSLRDILHADTAIHKFYFLSDLVSLNAFIYPAVIIPADVAARYADKYGVTTDWIIMGAAPKFRAELDSDGENDYSELKALFMKLDTSSLRTVAIEQLRVLVKLTEK